MCASTFIVGWHTYHSTENDYEQDIIVYELSKTVMDINSLRVDDYRYRLFCVVPPWTSELDFFTQRPFLTSVVFLTLHDILLTTRGRRGFIVLVFFFRVFFCDGLKSC